MDGNYAEYVIRFGAHIVSAVSFPEYVILFHAFIVHETGKKLWGSWKSSCLDGISPGAEKTGLLLPLLYVE